MSKNSRNSSNSKFSYDYHQPKEYRFSLDSVFLAQKVAAFIEEAIPARQRPVLRILDLCAGCGVIGMELAFHLPDIKTIDFVEVQEVYRPYFQQNIALLNRLPEDFRFILKNYAQLAGEDEFAQQYDLVVCNPPYFFIGEGLLSPSEFKNRCRFFIDSDFEQLIFALYYSLKKEGNAFVLVRPGNHHGRNLFLEWKKTIERHSLQASVEIMDEVRGTNVIRMLKQS